MFSLNVVPNVLSEMCPSAIWEYTCVVCIDTEVQFCLSGIVLFVNKVHYHL